jgi:SET domain-containing protein
MTRDLVVRRIRGKGRGVFARRSFRPGEVIEVCPVIPMTPREANSCAKTILDDYYFEWGPGGRGYAVALGYGSLYNHADDPNAVFTNRTRQLQIVVRARKPIAEGEQITINYRWPEATGMPRSRV